MIARDASRMYVGSTEISALFAGPHPVWGADYRREVLADNPTVYVPADGTTLDVMRNRTFATTRTIAYGDAQVGQGLVSTGTTFPGGYAARLATTTPVISPTLTVEIWNVHKGTTFWSDGFACNAINSHFMIAHASTRNLGMWTHNSVHPGTPSAARHGGVVRPLDSNWHHLVHVITTATVGAAGTCTQYIDGVHVSTFTHGLDTTTFGVGTIGDWSNSGYPFGDWSDAAIYTHALSADRIAAHYAAAT